MRGLLALFACALASAASAQAPPATVSPPASPPVFFNPYATPPATPSSTAGAEATDQFLSASGALPPAESAAPSVLAGNAIVLGDWRAACQECSPRALQLFSDVDSFHGVGDRAGFSRATANDGTTIESR